MSLIIPNTFATKTGSIQLSDLDDNFTYLTSELDLYSNNILVDESGEVTIGGGVVADVTGNLTGDVTGNLTGDVTGNVSGNSGTVTNGVYTTGDQTIGGVKTFSDTLTLAAGTTTVAPLKLTSGTNLTSSVAGVVEYNGSVFMGTPSTYRGIIPTEHYFRLTTDAVHPDIALLQNPIFGFQPTSTYVSLAPNTQYEFEIQYTLLKTAGTTSHTLSVGFITQTGIMNGLLYYVYNSGANATLPVTMTAPTLTVSNSVIATQVRTATTSANRTDSFLIKGSFSSATSGVTKITPFFSSSAATGGAYSTLAGSYMRIKPLGLVVSGSNLSVGLWN